MVGNASNTTGIGGIIVFRDCGHSLIGCAKANANAAKDAAKE
jgi:hypothetical protein